AVQPQVDKTCQDIPLLGAVLPDGSSWLILAGLTVAMVLPRLVQLEALWRRLADGVKRGVPDADEKRLVRYLIEDSRPVEELLPSKREWLGRRGPTLTARETKAALSVSVRVLG